MDLHILENRISRYFPEARLRVPAKDISTFGVGGVIAGLIAPSSQDAVEKTLCKARRAGIPYRIFGTGSNIVFGDGNLSFLGIQIANNAVVFSGDEVSVGAGTLLSFLVDESIKRGLSGVENLTGIPGTVGGAICGNAGAYGNTISDSLYEITIFDGVKKQNLSREACGFRYRESVFKDKDNEWVILSARFRFLPSDKDKLRLRANEIYAERLKKYPPGLCCPGSFFKNVLIDEVAPSLRARIPKEKIIAGKIPAGFLLSEVGARGRSYGDLSVASYHGNLLINHGSSSCKDVRAFAEDLKAKVYARFGVLLSEEVRYIS